MKHTSETNGSNFESEVLNSKKPVLVAFGSPWSHLRRVFEITLNEVATECEGRAKVVKINADDNPDLSLWYDIQFIPTLLYFVGGSVRAPRRHGQQRSNSLEISCRRTSKPNREGIMRKRNKTLPAHNHPASQSPTTEEIRKRAYEIFVARGGTPGHELDDWILAEIELKSHEYTDITS